MVDIFSVEQAKAKKQEILKRIRYGEVFIHPTDTIYGLGCDATNETAVQRVRALKAREEKPFSVIAPSKEWIRENCDMTVAMLRLLPGPITVVCSVKQRCVAPAVSKGSTLGVRIPDHWISGFVRDAEVPVVTTSVNKAGTKALTSLEEFKDFAVDFIIYEGPKSGRASMIIDTIAKKSIVR